MSEVDKKKPVLVGSLIVGLLSALPVVNVVNACCCLWAIVGGAVATKMLIDRSPQPVKSGDGATIGLLTGLGGAVISFLIGVPLSLVIGPAMFRIAERLVELTNDPNVQQQLQEIIARMQEQSFGQRLFSSIFSGILLGVFLVGFTTLGGLLGVPLFEKRKGAAPQMPPQPPQYAPQPPPPAYPPPPPAPPAQESDWQSSHPELNRGSDAANEADSTTDDKPNS